MDNNIVARELLTLAKTLTASDVNTKFIKVLELADKTWKAYQNYLSRASSPYSKMMKVRESLVKEIHSVESEIRKNPNSKLSANLKTAEEMLKTIDSFEDPEKMQQRGN